MSLSFWDICNVVSPGSEEIPNDNFGNLVVGTGFCIYHGKCCVIKSVFGEIMCIWCMWVEMRAYGLGGVISEVAIPDA